LSDLKAHALLAAPVSAHFSTRGATTQDFCNAHEGKIHFIRFRQGFYATATYSHSKIIRSSHVEICPRGQKKIKSFHFIWHGQ
jgi:hypothetical protein